MKLLFPLLLFLTSSLATCVRAQNALIYKVAPEEQGFDPARLARVDSFLQDLVSRGIIPNAQTLIARRGKVVHRGTYGLADVETRRAAKPDNIYRIASQTKALVSVGLMRLFEQGKFLLEDPIANYLPAFYQMQVIDSVNEKTGAYHLVPATEPITIRHLLSHSAGIPYELPAEAQHPELAVPFFASLENETTEQVVNRIARRPLVHQPGEKFTYGLNTDVIGRLVEVLSGQPLDEYMQEHVFRPLGMTDSHFYLPTDKHARLVSLYSRPDNGGPLHLHENATYRTFATAGAQRYHSAGAGSLGTIDDYAKFCEMIRNYGRLPNGDYLLNPRTVRLMTRNHLGEAEVWNRRDKFGLGFQLITENSAYGDLATPGSFTWGGMYLSEYTIDPAEGLILLFYTNVHPIKEYSEIVRKFRILTYQALIR